ncbi:MAG: 2-phospho-L-lactate transferase [Methanosarcinales archaeon]|nr:2-phospho-L-lactate transferase [Methanosarcinales archaeon]
MLILSGGTGTPKLLAGLRQLLPDEDITVVVNTAEDLWVSGNLVCPDIDTVTYLFADILDTSRWWGIKQETYHTNETLASAGHNEILLLGDRDRATHIIRSEFIRGSASLTEAVIQTTRMLGSKAHILPMCDEYVSSMITTDTGTIHFQEFWVSQRGKPDVLKVEYQGIQNTKVTEAVQRAIENEKNIIIGPSNPITSIGPILAVNGMRDLIRKKHVLAVSPIIGCEPVSGPAGKLMTACDYEVSSRGVAKYYHDLLDVFIVDEQDGPGRSGMKDVGVKMVIADTIMTTPEKSAALARIVMEQLV